MTEEEAKTKRCCGPEGCGKFTTDRDTLQVHRLCIGSACMAWRSEFTYVTLNRGKPKRVNDGYYCGLAGKP